MTPSTLQQYLYSNIPMSSAMQISVLAVSPESVTLHAPLEPNINHTGTAFGGSESTLAILAAWSLLHVRLEDAGLLCTIIIQRYHMDYELPVPTAFNAYSRLTMPESWEKFLKTIESHGRARVNITAFIEYERQQAASFRGDFVAILNRTRV